MSRVAHRWMLRRFLAHCMIATAVLLAGCGKNSESTLRTVQMLEAKGDHAAAVAELISGLREAPDNGVLRYHLGRIYGLVFDGPAAEHEFRKARELGIIDGGRVALGLGRALLQQRKYREVMADVVAAAAFERDVLASVHALRGNALLTIDRIDEAKKELEAGVKLDPGNPDVVLLQARLKAGGRDVKGALQQVEKLLAKDPGNIEAWMHKGDLLRIVDEPREAIATYEKVLDLQPGHLHALIGRSSTLIQLGRLIDAQKDVDLLRRMYPKHHASAYLRGQIHYWRGEYREALDMAQVASKANAEDSPSQLLSGMANLMLDAPVRAEHEFARYAASHPRNEAVGRVLLDLRAETSRRTGGAKALASSRADELRAASVQALFDDAYVRVLQYSKVAEWWERVAGSPLPDPLGAVRRARERFSNEELALAASDLERAASLSASFTKVDIALVLAQLARSDGAKAMAAASAIREKSPKSPWGAALAGIVSLDGNRPADAARQFEEALQLDPKLILAVIGRARVDIVAGRLDLARARFEEALSSDPDNLQVLVFYAHLEESARRRSEAHRLLERAIKAHPTAVEPRVVLIDILRKENAKARALELAEKMLADHPENPTVIELVADVQFWSGRRDLAVSTLGRLPKLLPRSSMTYFKLARMQVNAGLKAEADANLRAALTMPGDEPETEALPVWGLLSDAKTREALKAARASYREHSGPTSSARVERQPWPTGSGGGSLYEALSGAR